ncbi:MAG: C-terminal binding protein [Clostridiales bacterium]|nr:C-terminal binding protein [Clostridiales bacterium]
MKIVISDNDHVNLAQEEAVFQKAGMDFTLYQCHTEEEAIQQLKGAEIILNQYTPLTRQVIQALRPELKMIVRYGVGVDNIDCVAAAEMGVQVCNVPDYGMNEVADHAMALMLSLVRKTVTMVNYTKGTDWDYSYGVPIHRIPGQTVGIVGMGRIGRTFAKRMGGFDCRRIAYDPLYQPGTQVDGVELVSFDTLLEQSDMISIHCPLQPCTRDLFDLAAFQKMKRGAYLVNTSRGGIVNEEDLYTALTTALIAGAALDVTAKEPLPRPSKLLELENFLCTPHIAWYSEEAAQEMKRKVAEEAVRFATGEKVLYPVNQI